MPRALDDSPPGDWTLKFLRDDAGAVHAVQVGCWLARGIVFTRATS
jgi:D-aminopeptidase